MQEYLQDFYKIPIVIREKGSTSIKCPYCSRLHAYSPEELGHMMAQCEDCDTIVLHIGDRSFIKPYGFSIVDYEEKDGLNHIILPPNLLSY